MGRNRRNDPREKNQRIKAMFEILDAVEKNADAKPEEKPKHKKSKQLKLF